jgi:hypothetical protein
MACEGLGDANGSPIDDPHVCCKLDVTCARSKRRDSRGVASEVPKLLRAGSLHIYGASSRCLQGLAPDDIMKIT